MRSVWTLYVFFVICLLWGQLLMLTCEVDLFNALQRGIESHRAEVPYKQVSNTLSNGYVCFHSFMDTNSYFFYFSCCEITLIYCLSIRHIECINVHVRVFFLWFCCKSLQLPSWAKLSGKRMLDCSGCSYILTLESYFCFAGLYYDICSADAADHQMYRWVYFFFFLH